MDTKISKKILIVDDDSTIGKTLGHLLKYDGYEVFIANNGQDGYEKAKQLFPDLIIMDYKMPVMNGWEATRMIRQLIHCTSIPILGNTAYASEENVIEGMNAGLTEVVKKPFNVEKLQNLIKKHLGNN
jgi:CheY-like chemotaxis protein